MRPLSRARSRRLLTGSATLAVALGGLAGLTGTASANTAGPGPVINEVYGGGGNSGATLKNDFVEIRNTTTHTISLGGLSLQYRSATGTGPTGSSNIDPLPSVDVPAGATYLVQEAAGLGGMQDLPTPDHIGSIGVAATGGQLFLADSTSAIDPGTGDISNTQVLDFVGWGSATAFEAAKGPATTNTTSVSRDGAGTDTNSNVADFTAGSPTPSACGAACPTTPPPPPTPHTIAEIQGTGDTSPYAGQPVVTEGVVTAAYPTGGFFGYTIQTDGTGSGPDATQGESDAVFVHQPSGAVAATVGDLVKVTGTVSEFNGLTELNVDAADLHDEGTAPTGVTPLSLAYPTTDAGREAHESELVAPTDQFTVTDNFSTNQYGEIGLATGDHQLWQPTDLFNPRIDPAGVASVQADNAARGVVLNDGATANYLTTSKNTVMPWLRPDNPVRVGSTATLRQPVILDFRNGLWELQPTHQVTDDGSAVATFSDTRTPNLRPQAVGGDLELGTFNVENFFPTSAAEYDALTGNPNACTSFKDREGNPIDVNQCSPNGPRGAWDQVNLDRQLAKEVKAINLMNVDVMSLEEIENSVQFGKNRDDALAKLVDALNADAGSTRWAFAPSPSPADLPAPADQDVIRTAFIYNPNTVQLVGPSTVLSTESGTGGAFENAREPLAQEFKRKGAFDSDGFLVVVNHFKSKGSGVDDGTGQGLANPDRIRQAHALVDFAQATAQADGTRKIFLVGDFNSYTQEDPMQVLYQNGFVNQPSDDKRDTSYEFGGMAGSLDHVLANTAAASMVTGRDVWQINAEESVGFEYSRFNYNAEPLYAPDQFRASDHNPELVGLSAPFTQQESTTTATASPSTIQKKKGTSRIDVTVSGALGATPTGTVELWIGGQRVATATLANGTASTVVGPFAGAGTQVVEVRYLGDQVTKPSSTTVSVTVTNGPK
ncbi:ExeM/NucH family extracellular endonuclease [Nocardioides cynanchi]|uniref:ExeM/NucH family extracellular endonuclease n=1 Tax=Nocardioides cynanchi TaxID=2558918 RepID=UPI001245B1FD|nr:ExeM/NucH family extracellular endonuclease [Nocardioides cynanchi]